MAVYEYSCGTSMHNEAFYSSDGEFLIVPQEGTLFITTEFGKLTVQQKEICVMPRGVKFAVEVEGPSNGWACEVYNSRFTLPDLGTDHLKIKSKIHLRSNSDQKLLSKKLYQLD